MSFSYTIPANTYYAATKAEANALAEAAARSLALQAKFCCLTPAIDCCVGEAVDQDYVISLGTTPFTWQINSGLMPAGLSLTTTDGGRTMKISGTPTTAGNITLGFDIADATGTQITQSLDINVRGITDSSLPDGQSGVAYSQQLTAAGGSGSHKFVVTTGTLPPGLSLSVEGLLQGVPTTPGTYAFTVQLTDQALDAHITASMQGVILPAVMASAIQFTDHTYQIRDYATIFATPPAEANYAMSPVTDTIWDGYFGDLNPLRHLDLHSAFNNWMQGPEAILGFATNPPILPYYWREEIEDGISYWWLEISFPSTLWPPAPDIPAYVGPPWYWTLWQGYMVSNDNHVPAGIYTRIRGLWTTPEYITIDQVL